LVLKASMINVSRILRSIVPGAANSPYSAAKSPYRGRSDHTMF